MHELIEVSLVLNVLAQMMIISEQLPHAREPLGHDIEYGALISDRQLLRQLADFQSWRTPDLAVVRQLAALDQAEHAGFSGAVTADNAHPLTPRNLPGHSIEQWIVAIGEGHIGQLEQGHGYLRKTGRAF